jgi:hypothetical protein
MIKVAVSFLKREDLEIIEIIALDIIIDNVHIKIVYFFKFSRIF